MVIAKKKKYIIIFGLCILFVLFVVGCGNKIDIENGTENDQNKDTVEVNTLAKPEEMGDASLIEYQYTFKTNVISEEYLDIYGEEIEKEFFDFCDSIIAIDKSFPCKSKNRLYELLSISNSCFPLAGELIDKEKTYVENGVCYISYNYADSEVSRIIEAFQDKVSGFISDAIPYDEPDYIKAMELYSAIAKKNTYDDAIALDDSLSLKSYRVIMNDVGICQEITGEYIYYLLQVGIDAIPCSGLSRDNEEAHEWVLMHLDGKYYHVDPTYAINYPDSLFFYCLDDKQREYYGDFAPEQFTYAETEVDEREKYKSSDRRFEAFWLAKSYKIDHREKKIIIIDNNTDEEKEYDIMR